MPTRRITRLRPLAYIFWGLALGLGGALAVLLYLDSEPALSSEGLPLGGCSPAAPCLALVVDDVGRDLPTLERLLRLQAPITFGVLPHAPHTDRSVRTIRGRGRDLLVHLPMRPHDTTAVTDEALVLGMDGPLESVLQECLNRVPGAVGVSNHMGSQLTEQVGAMSRLMRIIKKRRLWVLDSRTTPRSVMCSEARRRRLACLERDLFLDHEPGREHARAQLDKAVALARQRGWAVAIGHSRQQTVEALEGFLRQPGAQVVALSALVSRVGLTASSGVPAATPGQRQQPRGKKVD